MSRGALRPAFRSGFPRGAWPEASHNNATICAPDSAFPRWHPRRLLGADVKAGDEFRLQAARTVRAAGLGESFGRGRQCVGDFVPRCQAIQPDAAVIRGEGLHIAHRIIQIIKQITKSVPSISYPNIVLLAIRSADWYGTMPPGHSWVTPGHGNVSAATVIVRHPSPPSHKPGTTACYQ